MRKLVAVGYGAVYLTEHDTVWPEREIAELQQEFPAIRIFPGVELSVGGEVMPLVHLLVLGTSDPAYLAISDVAEILRKARSEGHLTVLAHPFRWGEAPQMLEAAPLPDALELLTGNHDPYMARLSEAVAGRLGLAVVNAGDTHGLDFVNRYWIETDRPVERADDIRQIVLDRAYGNCPQIGQ